ncbi:hypothetical protein Asulf_01004 [Archaeoglobus sulfaticallidus PM70-1]|uniref:Thioredoxin-like fold domain-containing protein n=1 Tax=Archaeoglobus sulfaticallidus PM70-1 TaxID=387631 RepID=N0BDE4_9EURY|nr:thioredoxin family protein [Archaeoglobus sulfaticallidus]AGK61008.1 hypothetical protein Asulf_01004 [Archaeoglobus sulfaticallidus PM70-1]
MKVLVSSLDEKHRIEELGDDFEIELGDYEYTPVFILNSIRYHGFPEGIERKVITDMITLSNSMSFDPEIKNNLERIEKIKASFKVFISPFCPHCANLVRKLIQLSLANPDISLEIFDATRFEKLARKYEILSVPVTILNDRIRLVGDKSIEELLNWVENIDNEGFLMDYFRKMISDGKAEEIVQMVSDFGLDDFLVTLIEKGDFITRLGAMFLLENLAEMGKDVAKAKKKILELIQDRLNLESDRVFLEDAVMILGKIGDSSDADFLKKLLSSVEDKGLKEALMDAIDEIEGKSADS